MGNWIKIAMRNILKNKRRSFITLVAIAVGYAAISLFQGYTDFIYFGLRATAVHGEGLGHVNIFRKGWKENGKIFPEQFMIPEQEYEEIIKILKKNKDIVLVTPQLNISGLVSNGKLSRIFLAKGVIPEDEAIILDEWAEFRPVDGEKLSGDKYYGVEMGEELSRSLNLTPGSDGVVMGMTLDGQMNGLDMQVLGTYDTGIEATNDKFMRVTLSFAQSLYDTKQADRLVVLLHDWEKTQVTYEWIKQILEEKGYQCELRKWDDMSVLYKRSKAMFDVIFLFLFSIVFTIVIMSVLNTMGMTVLERTREIGTLRALGLKRSGVMILFSIEGGILGFIGSIFGIILNIAVWALIKYLEPTYIPPSYSNPVPLIVNLVPEAMIIFMLLMILLSHLASIVPAKQAAKQNVVDALGHI